MQQNDTTQGKREPIDFRVEDILRIIRTRWRVIAISMIFFLFSGVTLILLSTPKYEVRAIVGENPEHLFFRDGGAQSDSLLAVAGLADLAEGPITSFLVTITSTDLAQVLVEKHDMIRQIYPERWDDKTQTWKPPQSLVARLTGWLNILIGEPSWRPPTVEDLAAYISREVEIKPFKDTPYFEIIYKHPEGAFAVRFLNTLHEEADRLLRARDLRQIELSRGYLLEQIGQVDIQDHRTILVRLLLETERKRMLLGDELGYSVRILDHPKAPAGPTSPKPLLVLVISATCGVVLPILILSALHLRRSAAMSD